jgi:hypothetical protein
MPELLGRIHEGVLDVRIWGAQSELLEVFNELKDAYNLRLETGHYSAAKERRDLHEAFLERAATMGVRRKDAERLFRRWF